MITWPITYCIHVKFFYFVVSCLRAASHSADPREVPNFLNYLCITHCTSMSLFNYVKLWVLYVYLVYQVLPHLCSLPHACPLQSL